ncbi:MAG: S1C family serine protease [Roseburia sp.]
MDYNNYNGGDQYQNQYRDADSYNAQSNSQPPKKKKGGFGKTLAKCVALALVFGLVAGSAFCGTSYFWRDVFGSEEESSAGPVLSQSSNLVQTSAVASGKVEGLSDVSDIVGEVMPSIVAITNMSEITYQTWFGQRQTQQSESCGSGIIVSQDDKYIYIATNNHVVSDATTLTVKFVDESTVSAQVKGTDVGSDLAVVAVALSDMSSDTISAIHVATLGDSDALSVGEPSIAIGNALGYGQSVTTGVISALNREVTVTDEITGATVTNELVQTDAAINPGNSGGALLNARGEVIGINSVKYSSTAVEGVGYAIPINTASPIIEKLITRQVVDESQAAYLGISGVDVSDSVSQTYNMPEGVYLYKVNEGSPAEKAGLLAGDIITSFDGTEVGTSTELESAMKYCASGDTVEVVYQRAVEGAYQEYTTSITLGKKN